MSAGSATSAQRLAVFVALQYTVYSLINNMRGVQQARGVESQVRYSGGRRDAGVVEVFLYVQ